jgi:hypothetical protein
MQLIKASKFVKRQTRTSEFSYFNGDFAHVEKLAIENFDNAIAGYRDEVLLVPVCPAGFYSSVVPITEELEFETVAKARRTGEAVLVYTVAYGIKPPAVKVDIVLYRRDLLLKDELDRENLTGAEWEIVSINARTTDESVPMGEATIARNILAGTDHPFGKGGTSDPNTTAMALAESIAFWKTHAMIKER